MQTFSITTNGAPDTYQTIFTGDVQVSGICISYDFFSCHRYGFELLITRTNANGSAAGDAYYTLGQTSDCFRSEDLLGYGWTNVYRIVKAELRVRSADASPADTPVEFKLSLDGSCSCRNNSSNCCSVDYDPIRII